MQKKTFSNLFLFGYDAEKMFTDFCELFTCINAAGGIVENADGKILFIKRMGLWDFPKGKIESGETNEYAAIREVEEETGVANLKILSELNPTYHIYHHHDKMVLKKTFWFKMTTNFKGNLIPQTKEDIELAEWKSKNEAETLLQNSYRSLRDGFRTYFNY